MQAKNQLNSPLPLPEKKQNEGELLFFHCEGHNDTHIKIKQCFMTFPSIADNTIRMTGMRKTM